MLCLRLGVIKCHARGEVTANALSLRRNGSSAQIELAPGWSEANPRTHHLLNEELALWERSGPLKLELRR